MSQFTTNVRRAVASYLRAAIAIISATQGFNVFDARGWHGVAQSLAVAAGPPLFVFFQTLAADLDPETL